MSDLDVIRNIEKKIGVPLKKVSLDEIKKMAGFPRRAYAIDDSENVTGILLDKYPKPVIEDITELPFLSSIVLRFGGLTDIDFLLSYNKLQSLAIWHKEKLDLTQLAEVKNLTSLYLSSTNAGDYTFIRELKHLTSLDLSSTNVSDYTFIRELKNLTSLYLSSTNADDYTFIRELKNLTSLYLSSTNVGDYTFILDLKNLSSLDLSFTNASDYTFIREFKNLTSLDLSFTNAGDYSFIRELKNLTSLDLLSTNTGDYTFIRELKHLTSLDLSSTKAGDYTFIRELKNLTSLDLGFTKAGDYTFIRELKHLTSLDLSSTNAVDYTFIRELKNLTSLYLSSTKANDYTFIRELKNLISLYLSSTKADDYAFIQELKNLTWLGLMDTRAGDYTFIRELKELTWLDLDNTDIVDISFVKDLPFLHNIYLSGVKTLREPPQQVIEKGVKAIRNYFLQREEQGGAPLYEAKVLIVGEPGAGKTSLWKKLVDPDYPVINRKVESTLGVVVRKDFKFHWHGNPDVVFNASLWDFGGQDIQYMIHQYFLTEKSLYIMVTDERKQDTRYEYWFNIIQLLGKGSPVVTVLNKRDGVALTCYDHRAICGAFPALCIEQFELDLATDRLALLALREKIESLLCNLDHIGVELPTKWPKIRDELEGMKERKHIGLDEYFEVCRRHGIEKEVDALNLGGYLHALGAILHFREDTALRDLVILNPNWVVDALYTALSHEDIQKNSGHFTMEWLFDLWQNPRSEASYAYSEKECWQLLSLLKKDKFELCYELDESNHFISPQLLSDIPPDYDIDFQYGLDFRFRYHFMPEGIISRLIVRLNHLLREEEGRQLVWRFGAVLEREGCLAEVIQARFSSRGHREIHIRVTGADHRKMELLTIVRNEIEAIHAKSFRNIRFDILIPCNSESCAASEDPNLFVLNDLNRLSGFGDREVRCTKCGGMIHILSLVAGMMPDYAKFAPSMAEYKGAINLARAEAMGLDGLDESGVGGRLEASEITRQLLEIIKSHIDNPPPVHVNVQVNITNKVQEFKEALGMLKYAFAIEVEDERTLRKLERELDLAARAGDSVAGAPREEVENSSAMKRLKNFVEKMEDVNTRVGRAIKAVENGVGYARDIAGYYNKIAEWCGMPVVPSVFLKKSRKINSWRAGSF